jgi:hypothetical protein
MDLMQLERDKSANLKRFESITPDHTIIAN